MLQPSHAIGVPGWNHICDGLLKFMLCSFLWFPLFLKVLKRITKFFRGHLEDICSALELNGFHGASDVLRSLKSVVFIEWRWNSMVDSIFQMRVVLSVLRVHVRITISILDKLSDGGDAKACKVAILSDRWFCEFQFVDWAATELNTFRSWGNSCPCHQYEWFHNIKTTCTKKRPIALYCLGFHYRFL